MLSGIEIFRFFVLTTLKGHFYFQMRQLTMETVLSSTKVGGYVIMDVK